MENCLEKISSFISFNIYDDVKRLAQECLEIRFGN